MLKNFSLIKLNTSHWPHVVKASRQVLMRFQTSCQLLTQILIRLVGGLGTTSLKAWAVWTLRPTTSRISAQLLSKTYLCEPRNWYPDCSLIRKPFNNVSRKTRVTLRQHRDRPLQCKVFTTCICRFQVLCRWPKSHGKTICKLWSLMQMLALQWTKKEKKSIDCHSMHIEVD